MTKKKLVLLRHGESQWNLEGRFTGWTDVDLSPKGIEEARAAGELLAKEGYAFDQVYTSVLTRAIRTNQLATHAMGQAWLPVTRHWRLNERHYGALQGLNKKETAKEHGEEQVFAWRRSYHTPPPSLRADDERHPSRDRRYAHLPRDVLPGAECLADVVARMTPYWYDEIAPAVLAGRRVLIVAHGNSLRALVKHLDGISDEEISGLNIPTGIPLVYEFDDALRPLKSYYLGDQEAAEAAAAKVANQAK